MSVIDRVAAEATATPDDTATETEPTDAESVSDAATMDAFASPDVGNIGNIDLPFNIDGSQVATGVVTAAVAAVFAREVRN